LHWWRWIGWAGILLLVLIYDFVEGWKSMADERTLVGVQTVASEEHKGNLWQ